MKIIKYFVLLILTSFSLRYVEAVTPFVPIVISTPGVNASESRCTVDINGNVTAVWIENTVLQSNSATMSGSWGTITPISNSGASDPSVQVDQTGLATALWLENETVISASRALQGSWSSFVTLSTSPSDSPALAIDINGNLVAVWVENDQVYSSTQLFNGNWSSPPDVLSETGVSSPRVAIGAGGTVVAVWDQLVSTTYTIFSASKSISGSWGAAQSASSAGANSRFPRIVVDSNGNATAIWYSFQSVNSVYSNVTVQSSSMPLSGSWNTPIGISEMGSMNPAVLSAALGVDNTGNIYAIWSNSTDDSTFNIQWGRQIQGAWDSLGNYITKQNLLSYQVSAAVDTAGAAYNFWTFYDQPSASLIVQGSLTSFSQPLAQVSIIMDVSAPGGQNAFPFVTTNLTGTNSYGVGTWTHYDGTSNVIQAVVNVFTPVLPPTNFSVMQQTNDYVVLTEDYNLLTWDASLSPTVTSYFITRNGVNIAVVPSYAALQYVDHNRIEGEIVTYTIYAYDSSYRYSVPVSVVFGN